MMSFKSSMPKKSKSSVPEGLSYSYKCIWSNSNKKKVWYCKHSFLKIKLHLKWDRGWTWTEWPAMKNCSGWLCKHRRTRKWFKFGCLFRIIGFKYNASNQFTHSPLETGGCCGILREKMPVTTPTSSSFWSGRGKEITIHTLYYDCYDYMNQEWMYIDYFSDSLTTHSAASQMDTTITTNTFETFTL